MSCPAYHSVPSNAVVTTSTSLRTPSTSWAYHSGKRSLSPTVTRTPYGSTELRRSFATSRVATCSGRGATAWFAMSGMSAITSTGAVASQLRVGIHQRPPGLVRLRPSSTMGGASERLPEPHETKCDPDAPGRVAPQIEVVAVAGFAGDGLAELRRLRRPVLEVHVPDERGRHGEDQGPRRTTCCGDRSASARTRQTLPERGRVQRPRSAARNAGPSRHGPTAT